MGVIVFEANASGYFLLRPKIPSNVSAKGPSMNPKVPVMTRIPEIVMITPTNLIKPLVLPADLLSTKSIAPVKL